MRSITIVILTLFSFPLSAQTPWPTKVDFTQGIEIGGGVLLDTVKQVGSDVVMVTDIGSFTIIDKQVVLDSLNNLRNDFPENADSSTYSDTTFVLNSSVTDQRVFFSDNGVAVGNANMTFSTSTNRLRLPSGLEVSSLRATGTNLGLSSGNLLLNAGNSINIGDNFDANAIFHIDVHGIGDVPVMKVFDDSIDFYKQVNFDSTIVLSDGYEINGEGDFPQNVDTSSFAHNVDSAKNNLYVGNQLTIDGDEIFNDASGFHINSGTLQFLLGDDNNSYTLINNNATNGLMFYTNGNTIIPTITFQGDQNTGLGRTDVDQVSLFAGGVTIDWDGTHLISENNDTAAWKSELGSSSSSVTSTDTIKALNNTDIYFDDPVNSISDIKGGSFSLDALDNLILNDDFGGGTNIQSNNQGWIVFTNNGQQIIFDDKIIRTNTDTSANKSDIRDYVADNLGYFVDTPFDPNFNTDNTEDTIVHFGFGNDSVPDGYMATAYILGQAQTNDTIRVYSNASTIEFPVTTAGGNVSFKIEVNFIRNGTEMIQQIEITGENMSTDAKWTEYYFNEVGAVGWSSSQTMTITGQAEDGVFSVVGYWAETSIRRGFK